MAAALEGHQARVLITFDGQVGVLSQAEEIAVEILSGVVGVVEVEVTTAAETITRRGG